METQITQTLKGEHAFYFQGTCGKTSACVSVYHDGRFQVVCQNAAHRVWRKMGKHFRSFEEAVAGYRSSEMKTLISAARLEASAALLKNKLC